MKANVFNSLKQYAKVSRTFPKLMGNGTNARIRVASTAPGMGFKSINEKI